MGGVSRSTLRSDPGGHAFFEGKVALVRNGGLASVRSARAERGKAGARFRIVEVRGEAGRFKLNLLTADTVDGLNDQTVFTPDPDRWQTLRIPLAKCRPSVRGREVHGAPPPDPARIHQVGRRIADPEGGPFAPTIWRIGLT